MSKKDETKDKVEEKETTKAKKSTSTKRKIDVKANTKVDEEKDSKNDASPKTKGSTKKTATTKKKDEEDSTEEKEVELDSLLPENYIPTITKFGIGDGFISIPGRVYNFIKDNEEDWFIKYDEYKYFGEEEFFKSIIYYILEDGYVNIQNLQDNKYYQITINK